MTKCCAEKGYDGCWECDELPTCNKGFVASNDGHLTRAASLFIKKYGKEESARVSDIQIKMEDKIENYHDAESCLAFLEKVRKNQ